MHKGARAQVSKRIWRARLLKISDLAGKTSCPKGHMQLFQNAGIYPAYIPRLRVLTEQCANFQTQIAAFLNDRFGAVHFLQPILAGAGNAFFSLGGDEVTQRQWAREHGLSTKISLERILLSQIEEHHTEVFYNLDPMQFGSSFVRKLPGCVKVAIAWRAAPSPGADFHAYDTVLCNFPSIIEMWKKSGYRSEYFAPAHDSFMDNVAITDTRPIDVLFVGGYSRNHMRRALVLEEVSRLSPKFKIVYHLDYGKLTKLAATWLGALPHLRKHRQPNSIRAISSGPIFGVDLYRAIGMSKIVLNGAIDMAGNDRGNMRCFEAMGCGSLLVSDEGNYPPGMRPGENMLTYACPKSAANVITAALLDWDNARTISSRGHTMVKDIYSKARQWTAFQQIVSRL